MAARTLPAADGLGTLDVQAAADRGHRLEDTAEYLAASPKGLEGGRPQAQKRRKRAKKEMPKP